MKKHRNDGGGCLLLGYNNRRRQNEVKIYLCRGQICKRQKIKCIPRAPIDPALLRVPLS